MDRKKFQELRQRPVVELEKEVRDLRNALWNLRKDLVAGKVKNVREIRSVKKSIAQLLTLVNAAGAK